MNSVLLPLDTWTRRIPLQRDATERFICAAEARHFARLWGMPARECSELAVATSELVSNVTRHAYEGMIEFHLRLSPRPLIEVICRDRGPGIEDLDIVRKDGYSRGRFLEPDSPREEGLGTGLGAVERLVDELSICSAVGVGTTVIVRKWLP
jgi:serine/threonine-protein kinase RsbT